MKCVSQEFLVNLLGVASLLMLPDQGLASVGLEGSGEHGEHEVLLDVEESNVVGQNRFECGIQDISHIEGVNQGGGVALPGVPLVVMLKGLELGGVTLDAAAEVVDTIPGCRRNSGGGSSRACHGRRLTSGDNTKRVGTGSTLSKAWVSAAISEVSKFTVTEPS